MQHRRSFIISVIFVSALATAFAVFLAPSAFRWSVFAQAYTTPEPPTEVPQPPESPTVSQPIPISTESTISLGNATIPSRIEGDAFVMTFIGLVEGNDRGNPFFALTNTEFSLIPSDILSSFENSDIANAIDLRTLAPEERLIQSFTFSQGVMRDIRIDIYILEGSLDGETRYQVNIYRDGVLVDDRIELLIDADGDIHWLFRA